MFYAVVNLLELTCYFGILSNYEQLGTFERRAVRKSIRFGTGVWPGVAAMVLVY